MLSVDLMSTSEVTCSEATLWLITLTSGWAALQERSECEEYLAGREPALRPFVATVLLLMHELAKVRSLVALRNVCCSYRARTAQDSVLLQAGVRQSVRALPGHAACKSQLHALLGGGREG